MTFISVHDRTACIAALIDLFGFLSGIPGIVSDTDKKMSAEEIRKTCEEAYDNKEPNEQGLEVLLGIWQSMCIKDSYYECRMTFEPNNCSTDTLADIGAKYHFHMSVIDGDEVMGEGYRWCLTRSLTDGAMLANDMNAFTMALDQAGIPILRRKIEHIVFDERRDKLAGTGRAS